MELFGSIPCILLAIAVIFLNAIAAIFSGRISFVLTLVSLGLHVAIAPVMLLSLCPLSELALVYSASFFAYLLPIYIKKKGEKNDL